MKQYNLFDFHLLYRELDESYGKIQKHYDIPETEFWCLIAIRIGMGNYQHEISRLMNISKQTVNSSLKQLEKKQLICLDADEINHRSKIIKLSEKGIEFAKKYIDPIDALEDRAWNRLTEEEQEQLITITKKLCVNLNHEVDIYIKDYNHKE